MLVCSDVISRGIDLPRVDCVINYDAPTHIKTYVHRVGRTARAGKAGLAVTLLEAQQVRHFKQMLRKAENAFTALKERKVKGGDGGRVEAYRVALGELQKVLEHS